MIYVCYFLSLRVFIIRKLLMLMIKSRMRPKLKEVIIFMLYTTFLLSPHSYRQSFDLEGETGIVVRGLGSAVTLVRLHYDTGGAGTTHSPSPLRELTNQRE